MNVILSGSDEVVEAEESPRRQSQGLPIEQGERTERKPQ